MKSALILDSPRTHVLAFQAGDEAVEQLQKFVKSREIKNASFTAIGAFERCVLAYFAWERRSYEHTPVDEQVELLSMIGNVAAGPDGGVKLHAHVVVGKRDITTRGGHLISGHVRPTLEVVLVESPAQLQRTVDPESDLPLIDLSAEKR